MNETIFEVPIPPEGGITARAPGISIHTEADTRPALGEAVRDTIRCHFVGGQAASMIRG